MNNLDTTTHKIDTNLPEKIVLNSQQSKIFNLCTRTIFTKGQAGKITIGETIPAIKMTGTEVKNGNKTTGKKANIGIQGIKVDLSGEEMAITKAITHLKG